MYSTPTLAALSLDQLADPLVIFGFVAQGVFMFRMVLQWIASEKRKRSYVPVSFWWISLIGALMLVAYGWLRSEPVIVFGQGLGLAVYIRNLVLIYQRKYRFIQRRKVSNAGSASEQPIMFDAGPRAAEEPSA
ncbi:MAG: lipid-A-disaccharide synthase N-terminal domain-containing protein [Phycisphaerae bacterium]